MLLDVQAAEPRPALCPESASVENAHEKASVGHPKDDPAGSALVGVIH